MKKFSLLELVVAIIIPLAVGSLSAFLSGDSMAIFDSVKKPALSPPGYLFPIVWIILYVMMGVASYLVFREKGNNLTNKTLILYAVQLVFNFFWSIIFFRFSMYKFAFLWLLVLWVFVLMFIMNAMKINKISAYLMVPYLIWMTFAGYLNIMIAVLN